jgi:hypothetical protein
MPNPLQNTISQAHKLGAPGGEISTGKLYELIFLSPVIIFKN